MISVHFDLPISQCLPKFQGRVLSDSDGSQAGLSPFSPIEVIEIRPRRIESRARFGVCHEYIVVSDRDTCNGLLNFRVGLIPCPDASGGENDDEMDTAEPAGLEGRIIDSAESGFHVTLDLPNDISRKQDALC